MSRPLDRNSRLPALGEVDEEGGEFWVENPFEMPGEGFNLSAYERNRLYLNTGDGRFVEGSHASGADLDSDSRSVVTADFDRDGRPDLLVASVGGGPLRLFLNRIESANRRLRLELVGREANRQGIGTRLEIVAGGRTIRRDLFVESGGMALGPASWTVGVGPVERVERLTLTWPDGTVQRFEDLPADRSLTLIQGEPKPKIAPLSLR